MCLALEQGHVEAAKILASKGADCTEQEKAMLGERYTNFLRRDRTLIRQWIDSDEFAKLQQWLCQWEKELEGRMEAGELPVVGWLQLEAEVEQNERECQQIALQISHLQQDLEIRNQKLQEKMKKQEELAALTKESQTIAMLCKREEAALSKLLNKLENPYYNMEGLDFEDVSTVFSMFNMDSLFSRFKKNDVDNNLEVTANATVVDLQKIYELEFPEAVELRWKLKLLKKGEKGEAGHLRKCSICSSSNPGGLLREYGMKEEERAEIEAKMEGWKGYYFAAVNAASAAAELGPFLAPGLRQKFTTCWARVHKAHKWKHSDSN